MSTILDVAKRAGVSKATVSRVLNNPDIVKEATRRAVFEAIETLNYRPNLLARSLAHNVSNSIGLVVSDFEGTYFGRLLKRAAVLTESQGKHLIITDGKDSAEQELQAVQLLADKQCDAIILYTRYLSETSLNKLLSTLSTPLMIVNRDLPGSPERCVFFRQQQSAFDAVDYLIGQGHREIACITGPMKTLTAYSRLEGYQEALNYHAIPFEQQRVVNGKSTVDSGYHACLELLSRSVPFTALFCCNDDMAIGAMRALGEAGKRVPEDVSLFGFDDEPSAAYLQPALSTVYLPIDAMIETAIRQALKLAAGKNVEALPAFSGELRIRESVSVR